MEANVFDLMIIDEVRFWFFWLWELVWTVGTTKDLVPETKTLWEKDSVKSANSIKPNNVPKAKIISQFDTMQS